MNAPQLSYLNDWDDARLLKRLFNYMHNAWISLAQLCLKSDPERTIQN